jgi:hypothetical protein
MKNHVELRRMLVFRSLTRKVHWLIVLSSLFAIPALAQFEIAPEHFDAQDKQSPHRVAHKRPKTSAQAAQPATVLAATAVLRRAETAPIPDPQKGAPGARHRAQRLPRRNHSGNHMAATRRKRSDKERPAAAAVNSSG